MSPKHRGEWGVADGLLEKGYLRVPSGFHRLMVLIGVSRDEATLVMVLVNAQWRKGKATTQDVLVKDSGMSWRMVRRHLLRLERAGHLQRLGPDTYDLSPLFEMMASLNDAPVHESDSSVHGMHTACASE